MTLNDGALLELNELVNAAVDGRLTGAQRERLQQCLRTSEAARRAYVRMMGLSADLAVVAAESQSSDGSSGSVRRVRRPRRRRARQLLLLAAAASVPIAVGVAFWLAGDPQREPTTSAVAALTRAVDVEWADPAAAPRVGAALPPGWLRFRSGLVQIEFHSGATVRARGPAEIRIDAPDETFCRAGRLVATVPPPASGFRVGTPRAKIVDRGTVFGLEVADGTAAVHVFEGRAEIDAGAAGQRALKAGEAAAVGPRGAVRDLLAEPARFAFARDLERYAEEAHRWRCAAWLDAVRRLDDDPDTIFHYTFERESTPDRILPNTTTSKRRGTDGAIVGARWAEGRWRGKGALEFRSVSDRVRLNVPGTVRSLTLAAWIRIHGLDRAYNSLFMCEGFSPGDLHWQIQSNGRFDLGLAGIGIYHSPVVFRQEHFGQWTHVAVTIDADANFVHFYVNGRKIDSQATGLLKPFRLGRADLGSWSNPAGRDFTPIRHFSGRMDEFLLLARVLNAEEIRRLYEDGKP